MIGLIRKTMGERKLKNSLPKLKIRSRDGSSTRPRRWKMAIIKGFKSRC